MSSYFPHSFSESQYVLRYRQRKPKSFALRQDTPNKYSFHIFNNHSERVHVFGNQLDYVWAHVLRFHLNHPLLRMVARHCHFDVGFYGPMCLLWFLLHSRATKSILHACFRPSCWLCLRHPPPNFPPPEIPTLSSHYVRWTRTIIYHPDHSWNISFWVGNTNAQDES